MVGVLVLVDQHVPEPPPVALRDVRVRLEQVHRRHDQVVEVQRVRLAQPPLVERVRLGERPLVGPAWPARRTLRVDQLVLQVGHLGGQPARRVALRVEIQLAGDQLHQPARVVRVVDRERRLEAGVLVLGAQDAHARRVERRHPHQPGPRPDQRGDPLLHLAGGLVGEGDRDDLAGMHVPCGEQVGDPVGEHPGLAGPGAGHDQQRRAGVADRVALRPVQPGEQLRGSRRAAADPGRCGRAGADSGAGGDAGMSKRGCIAPTSLCRRPDTTRLWRSAARARRRAPHRTPTGVASAPSPRNACAPGVDVGILDGVIAARYYFYYGTGSPAAVGRA